MSRPLPDKYESSGGFLSLSAASTQANERKGGETSGAEKTIVRERKNLFILCSGFTVSHDTDSCPPTADIKRSRSERAHPWETIGQVTYSTVAHGPPSEAHDRQ